MLLSTKHYEFESRVHWASSRMTRFAVRWSPQQADVRSNIIWIEEMPLTFRECGISPGFAGDALDLVRIWNSVIFALHNRK